MDILPEEIINKILLLVNKPTLYYASQVCSVWKRLSLNQVRTITNFVDFKKSCRQGDHLSVIHYKFGKNGLKLVLMIAAEEVIWT